MGCDIHLYVEVRDGKNWKSADKWTVDKYAENGELSVGYKDRFYHERNYDLFSILADVRNGRGFSGVRTGDGFVPICDQRGLPKDACAEVKAESDAWNGDGHSHSWLTVRELMDYDWTQVTRKQGWVDGQNFYDWSDWAKEEGEGPKEYSGGVSGGSVVHVSKEEMTVLIDAIKQPFIDSGIGGWNRQARELVQEKLAHTYCLVDWETPYYKNADTFLSETLPRLWRLGKPEDVRIVFWFDN